MKAMGIIQLYTWSWKWRSETANLKTGDSSNVVPSDLNSFDGRGYGDGGDDDFFGLEVLTVLSPFGTSYDNESYH